MLTRLISTLLGTGFWVIIAVAKSLQEQAEPFVEEVDEWPRV